MALALVAAVLVGCEHGTTAPEPTSFTPPSVVHPGRAITPEAIATYEGSGQVVHPDVVYTPPGIFAHAWHLVLTPYPAAGAVFENPSVYASDDGVTWQVEPGTVNPVAAPSPERHEEDLSDPALVFVPESRELWLYYRSFTMDSDFVWLMRTSDAVHWSSPAMVLATGGGEALSPSVVHRTTGEWRMWTVSGHCGLGMDTHIDMRTSADGLVWSSPLAVTLAGLSPWHVFVRWVASLSTWMLATNVKTRADSCLTKKLYLALSTDGVQWTPRDTTWLVAGEDSAGLFSTVVYRSAFAEVGDSLRFWYSGASMSYVNYTCRSAGQVCTDSLLRWGGLGTEIRLATDVLPR